MSAIFLSFSSLVLLAIYLNMLLSACRHPTGMWSGEREYGASSEAQLRGHARAQYGGGHGVLCNLQWHILHLS